MFIDAALVRFKRPSEEFRLVWDFVNDIESGDTLAAREVKAYDMADDSDVSATFLENPEIVGQTVRVQVQAGTAGHDYIVRFQATSTQGDKWQRVVKVKVRA